MYYGARIVPFFLEYKKSAQFKHSSRLDMFETEVVVWKAPLALEQTDRQTN